MNPKLKDDSVNLLFDAVLTLKTVEECYAFFEDLCTVHEIKSMAQRMSVAQMLDKKHLYNDISKETGASTATISRVKRSLAYGSDGYALALERMKNK